MIGFLNARYSNVPTEGLRKGSVISHSDNRFPGIFQNSQVLITKFRRTGNEGSHICEGIIINKPSEFKAKRKEKAKYLSESESEEYEDEEESLNENEAEAEAEEFEYEEVEEIKDEEEEDLKEENEVKNEYELLKAEDP